MPRPASAATLPVLAAACAPALTWTTTADDVARYRASFAAAAGERFVAAATAPELAARTDAARVLWLGDHHTSERLHRRQLELLHLVRQRGRPLLLVLEAIGAQDDADVAEHLAGRTSAAELRAALRRRWPRSWLDDDSLDAAHYRALVELARRHRLAVRGLERTPRATLPERDAAMAARVRGLAAACPDHLLVVVVGQAHLLGPGGAVARTALPAVVVGGEPPPALAAATPPAGVGPGGLARSDGGAWWFTDLLAGTR